MGVTERTICLWRWRRDVCKFARMTLYRDCILHSDAKNEKWLVVSRYDGLCQQLSEEYNKV